MAKLTLERVMRTSFDEMCNPDPGAARKAFRGYNRQIKLLGITSRLGINDIRELIRPEDDVSNMMAEVAASALAEKDQGSGLYLLGCTAVAARRDGPNPIMGVHDVANSYDGSFPELTARRLMLAMWALGEEQYATTVTKGTASLIVGYRAVEEALTGRDFDDTVQEERHLLGGSSGFRSFNPTSTSMRFYEGEVVMAAVSDVRPTKQFHDLARSMPSLDMVVKQVDAIAEARGYGVNLLAGSLGSTLATLMLEQVVQPGFVSGRFTDRAFASAVARHESGINIH